VEDEANLVVKLFLVYTCNNTIQKETRAICWLLTSKLVGESGYDMHNLHEDFAS